MKSSDLFQHHADFIFSHFQKFNGFNYNEENDPSKEFERLAKHMKWTEVIYNKNREKFLESIDKQSNNKENSGNKEEENTYGFFNHFQKFNNFHYNEENNTYKEFERLVKHMNWTGVNYKKNRDKFLETLGDVLCDKKNKGTADDTYDFFNHFQKFNGFHYNEENDPCKEFDRLTKHMHWTGVNYNKNREKFLESRCNKEKISEETKEKNDYNAEGSEDDTYDIKNFHSTQEYFRYFQMNYNFKYNIYDNAKVLFNELAKYMKWSGKSTTERTKFHRFRDSDKLNYLKQCEKGNNWKYKENLSLEENFEDFINFMNWDQLEIKQAEFDEMLVLLTERIWKNYKKLL